MSFASMTAIIGNSITTGRGRSPPSSIGCHAGVTRASSLLQLTKRWVYPLLSHGRTRVLHGKRRDPQGQADLPELPQRFRIPRALESLPQEERSPARRGLGRPQKVRQSHFL